MLIACSNGEWSDIYYVEEVDTLEELQEYVKEKRPVLCYKTSYIYRGRISLYEEMSKELVYLDNYKHIYEPVRYLMTKEELDKLTKIQCHNCQWGDGSLSGSLRCRYEPDNDGGCVNYVQTFSLREWLKGCFVRKNN